MPLTVTSICERALRESGFPTQTAYVGTQTGDLVNRAAQTIAQLPLSYPSKSYSVTLASQQAYTIATATRTGTTCTITTTDPHGYTTGDLVAVAGVPTAGYNVTRPITVTSPTALTYTVAVDPGADDVGGTVTHVAHGLPSDYRELVPETAYLNGNSQRVYWPTDPADWAIMKAGFIDPGSLLLCRIIGGYLYVHAPPGGEVLTFEYQSNALFSDTTGFIFKQRLTADTDIWLLDDDMLILSLKWRFKKEKGLDDWQIDFAECRTYTRNYMAESRSARALIFGIPNDHGNGAPYFNDWAP